MPDITLRIEQPNNTFRPDGIEAQYTRSLTEQARGEVQVYREDWNNIAASIDERNDKFFIEVDGTDEFGGRFDDAETDGATVSVRLNSPEIDAAEAEPTDNNVTYQNQSAGAIATNAINAVPTLSTGTIKPVASGLSYSVSHGSQSKILYDLREMTGAEFRYNADFTVDFTTRLGSGRALTLGPAEGNIGTGFNKTIDQRENVTHVRVLGGESGPNQVTAEAVSSAYTGGRKVWRRYPKKEIIDAARAQDVADALIAEYENDPRAIEVECRVYDEDLDLGDTVTVDYPEENINRDLRLVSLTREITRRGFIILATLSNRALTRESRDTKRNDDIETHNRGHGGFVDRDQVTSGWNPSGDGTPQTLEVVNWPDDIVEEKTVELVVQGRAWRSPVDPLSHDHSVSIPDHKHDVDVTHPSHTHDVTHPSHAHDVTHPSHDHVIDESDLDHTHDVDVTHPSHDHDVTHPSHDHDVDVTHPNHDHVIDESDLDHTHDVDVTHPTHGHTVDESTFDHTHDVTVTHPQHDHGIPQLQIKAGENTDNDGGSTSINSTSSSTSSTPYFSDQWNTLETLSTSSQTSAGADLYYTISAHPAAADPDTDTTLDMDLDIRAQWYTFYYPTSSGIHIDHFHRGIDTDNDGTNDFYDRNTITGAIHLPRDVSANDVKLQLYSTDHNVEVVSTAVLVEYDEHGHPIGGKTIASDTSDTALGTTTTESSQTTTDAVTTTSQDALGTTSTETSKATTDAVTATSDAALGTTTSETSTTELGTNETSTTALGTTSTETSKATTDAVTATSDAALGTNETSTTALGTNETSTTALGTTSTETTKNGGATTQTTTTTTGLDPKVITTFNGNTYYPTDVEIRVNGTVITTVAGNNTQDWQETVDLTGELTPGQNTIRATPTGQRGSVNLTLASELFRRGEVS